MIGLEEGSSVDEIALEDDLTPQPGRDELRSCLYEGIVTHRRHSPVPHEFRYRLFLLSIDLDEVDRVFRIPRLWSTRPFSFARFRRSDYFGDTTRPLNDCIREIVRERTGIEVTGRIQLLTHVRYLGLVFNPVSFYYCFDAGGKNLQAVVAEVTNTPWNERHCYVVPCQSGEPVHEFECAKEFHVSPFMPMNLSYRWRLTPPTGQLSVALENHNDSDCVFDVRLVMKRRAMSPKNVLWTLLRFPFMTAQVILAIYWQALRLWWKNVAFVPHPRHQKPDEIASPSIPNNTTVT